MKRTLKPHLYLQVLAAIVIGVAIGIFFPHTGTQLKPLSDGFIRLIKMLIGPLIFCTVVTGMAGTTDLKKMGRAGIKTLIYFEIVSVIALITGLVCVNLIQPGTGMNINPALLDSSSVTEYTSGHAESQSLVSFLINCIPMTISDAFAKGNLLQILLFSLLSGYACARIGSAAEPFVAFIRSFSKILFAIIHLIMKLAPIGALGAMAFTVGKFGTSALGSLASLMGTFYLTCIAFIFIVLGSILAAFRMSIFKLLFYLRDELFTVLGTSSSEAALPSLMEKLENAGCSKSMVGLVIPTGYSFNLDGTSIYLTMAAVFIAQATNTPCSIADQLSLLAILMITSKGAAGVTGSGFITLAATLPVSGIIPVAGLALIVGIDRFMSEARALTNLIGNAVATLVISKWENELDPKKSAIIRTGK